MSMTTPKVKKSLTIHITQEDRNKLEDAVKAFRKRTGEEISAGKVARDQSLKWADRELKKHTEQV
jgi:predicted HTH domain antitoxin